MSRLVADDIWAILTIWQEARGEPDEGKLAVAEVIRNRTRQRYQSDGTVAGTVLAPFQFSGWNTTDPNRRKAAVIDTDDPTFQDCYHAWFRAKQGTDLVKQAVLYYNDTLVTDAPAWVAGCDEVARIGAHVFYRPKGSVPV